VEVNEEEEEEEEDEEAELLGEGREERGKESVELDEEIELEPIASLSGPSEDSLITVVIARTRTGSSGSLVKSPNHMTGRLME
jgi:hypothetical protein